MIDYPNILNDSINQIEYRRYEFTSKSGKVVLIQQLKKDLIYYAISENQIVYWSRNRDELEDWCNLAL